MRAALRWVAVFVAQFALLALIEADRERRG